MTVLETKITVCAIAISIPLIAAGCMGNSDADRIGQARGALVDLVEGEDSGAIVEHCPDEISDLRISMESGGWVIDRVRGCRMTPRRRQVHRILYIITQ